MARRESLRESLRIAVRDYSLVAAAAILLLFGYALSRHVIPNYHDLKTLEQRRERLKNSVAAQRADNARLRDEIAALEDPYYLAQEMTRRYRWRYPAEPQR